MADAYKVGIKRGGLNFKGEDDKSRKKRQKKHAQEAPDLDGSRRAAEAEEEAQKLVQQEEDEVPLRSGSGRISSSTTTLHGFETSFKEEAEVGDTVLLHHPTSLEVEERIVTGILSQRSMIIHQPFSKDVISTMEYYIRKDSLKLQQKAKAQIEEGQDPEELQDAAAKELQKHLEKKLRKQAKTITVREKTGMWGYKMVTKKLGKAASTEDALDERCAQGRDKRCW
mmetsp:Transcript_25870/g.59700  ORF Transcript_25870/g.59700 Transcript_25870/m.59700 type:complete len:226 (-) Transcript_25870:100-777(-)